MTPAQEQAVARRREPLLVAAGAGSGKTSVLVERFVRAVCEDGIAPERILAITFTERAAAELVERIRGRLEALGEVDAARRLERGAYVGTFHGFCARVLRAHAGAAGLEEDFEILDEALSGRLRRQAFADALGELVEGTPGVGEQVRLDGMAEPGEQGREGKRAEAVDLIAAYGADRARAIVLGVYAQLRSRGRRVPVLPRAQPQSQTDDDVRATAACGLWDELLERFGAAYEASKRRRAGLDFDDLELLAGELLATHADVREAWAERFELLMVDELQDVNPRQLQIVEAIERENLFTVGDELQSIYGFRHADVGLFRARDFALSTHGRSLRLARNFRGRRQLLEAVNAVFAKRFGDRYTPLEPGREERRERDERDEHVAEEEPLLELLLTDRVGWEEAGNEPLVGGPASSAPRWRQAEARGLAKRIAEMVKDGRAKAGEVAVLLRATGDIELYERALREHGLRTVASAGAFWDRQEVADLLACMRALADPADEVGLYGALAGPLVGCSSDALARLGRAAKASERSLWEVVCDQKVATEGLSEDESERVAKWCEWLKGERERADELTLAEMLERAIERGGDVARPRVEVGAGIADANVERKRANVRKLVAMAEEWERSEGRDLRGFLDEAAFQRGVGGGFMASAEALAEPDAAVDVVDAERRDAVQLMSVHAAKGLEFDVVCVADLGRTPSTSVPDLLVDGGAGAQGEGRIGLRLVGLADPAPRPTLDYETLSAERKAARAEEEERIVYVAMTRARERLLLSGSCDFASWPSERPGGAPIVWLGPALVADLPERAQAARERDAMGVSGRPETAPSSGPGAARAGPAATVDGTDVPVRCRLITPGMAD